MAILFWTLLTHLSVIFVAGITNGTSTSSSDFNYSHLSRRSSDYSHLSRQHRSHYTAKDPLYCPPCPQLHCFKHRKKRLHCKGGYTVGVCGCCRVCAKIENEECGGEHNYLGRCDKGLECELQPPTEVTFLRDGLKTVYKVQKGVCRKAFKKKSLDPSQCKPKCEPQYCMKNPRAICSAEENAENPSHCQENCQHTSCRACRFKEPEMKCPKCLKNDFKCIRDFGRCVRKKSCKQKTYPCEDGVAAKVLGGDFVCQVPDCEI